MSSPREEVDTAPTCRWGLSQIVKVHLPTSASTVRRASLPTIGRVSTQQQHQRRFSLTTPEPNTPSSLEKAAAAAAEHEEAKEEQEQEQEPEAINYLAYGSNLSAETFLGRRGIKPLSAVNVRVPSLELTFDLPGLPYVEPCFANCRFVGDAAAQQRTIAHGKEESAPLLSQTKSSKDPHWDGGLIGVVYAVTPEDYRTIIATEGGGAAYQDVTVACEVLPSPNSPSSLAQKQSIKAHTLLAPPSTRPPSERSAQASARYLALITTGAAEHSLPTDYQAYLHSLKPYTITTWGQFIGAAIFAVLWMPAMLAVAGLMKTFAGEDGKAPEWILKIQKGLGILMWGSYDGAFKRIFGDGERSIEADEDEDEKVGEEKSGL